MTVKPTTPLAPHLALDPIKATAMASVAKPTPAPWTWKRVLRVFRNASLFAGAVNVEARPPRLVRNAFLFYLLSVVSLAVTVDGFARRRAPTSLPAPARPGWSPPEAALSAVTATLWERGFNFVLIEYAVVTIGLVVYVENTIGFC